MASQLNDPVTADSNRPGSAAPRDDVFRELLDVLREHAHLELEAATIAEFRSVIDATVGDYLVAAMRQYGQDLWQDEKFRQFAMVNVRKISRAARQRGGDRPSAPDLRAAANDVILHAHDEYCAKLPNTIVPPGAVPKGPMCSLYIERLNSTTA